MKHWNNMSAVERSDRVRHLDEQGVEPPDQCARLGISYHTLHNFRRTYNLPAANDNFARSKWAQMDDHAKRAAITTMRAVGVPVVEMAAEFGVSKSTLYHFFKANGMVVERVVVVGGPPMVPARPVDAAAWAVLAGQPVDLMGLEVGMCKWPVGEGPKQMFCGCPSGRHSYCETHEHVRQFGMGSK